MFFRVLMFSLLAVAGSIAGLSQEPVKLEPPAILQLVDHRSEPIYPPIAKAAGVSGTVVFDVVIGPGGKLSSMKVVSGPAMLQQAAIDSLKKWSFHSFKRDGSSVPAEGELSINFTLGISPDAAKKDREIADRYFKVADECHKALAKQDNSPEAGAICKRAADIAEEFAPEGRFIEKRSSYVYAAWALSNCQDFQTALVYANKAVAVVRLGHDDHSGNGAAYGIRGIVEGDRNDLASADRDLTAAEEEERKALAWAKSVNFEHTDSYKASFAMYLRLHSALLFALNRSDEAKKKLDEMETLK